MSVRKLFNRPLNSIAHVDYLHLPGIITTDVEDGDKIIVVAAEVAAPVTKCPRCDAIESLQGDGAPLQGFWDGPDGRPRWVTLKKQVYRCKACDVSCTHDLPFLPTPKAQVTTRLVDFILSLMDLGITYSDIARITGPDERTIRDIRDKRDAERASNPVRRYTVFLGLDDWQHGDLRKKRAIFVDVGNKMPINLFETCKAEDSIAHAKPVSGTNGIGFGQERNRVCIIGLARELTQYLAMHPEARVIVIDMSNPFRNVLRKNCPQLVIVIDHFHVKQELEKLISKICDELAEVVAAENPQSVPQQQNIFGDQGTPQSPKRKRTKTTKEKRLAKKLKKYRKIFMQSPEKRSGREKKSIKAWAASYPMLADILDRRDAFYHIWDTAQSSEDAEAQFDAWRASLSNIGPDIAQKYSPFIATVENWRKEIFAYFDFPERPDNAFTEAMVREVKSWDDAGRHVSFEVLRSRFQYYVPKSKKGKSVSLRKPQLDQPSKFTQRADEASSSVSAA